jgi:hypothetical protein
MAGANRMIQNDVNVAKFIWGEPIALQDGSVFKLPSIDEMNHFFEEGEMMEFPCPIRFSIGAILFERQLWDDMRFFKVSKGTNLGGDEEQICCYCCNNSRPIMVSENIVVGHLSFGRQNEEMKKYYLEHTWKFMPPN